MDWYPYQGFWTTVVSAFLLVGGGLAFLGFSHDVLPMGLMGVIFGGLGIYFLVTKFFEILDELGLR